MLSWKSAEITRDSYPKFRNLNVIIVINQSSYLVEIRDSPHWDIIYPAHELQTDILP